MKEQMSLCYRIDFKEGLFGKYKKVADRLLPNSSILDIGCHAGAFGKILLELGHQVTGIDNDREAVEIARKNGLNIVLGDIEDYKVLSSINKQFDVILLMDILEHLQNPANILKRLKSVLIRNGRIIATLPNVAYWAVRKELLFGRWNYDEGGILDKTHLHFYTAFSCKEMIEESGYKIISFKAAEGMIPLQHIFLKLPILNILIMGISKLAVKIKPQLFACSFIIEAVPKN